MADDGMDRDPDRLEFGPLDPRGDEARFERLLREVRRAATPELIRRQAGMTLWGQIAGWWRPILTGAAALSLGSILVLARVHPSMTAQLTARSPSPASSPAMTGESALAGAFGVPGPVALWLQATDKPTLEDLLGVDRSNR